MPQRRRAPQRRRTPGRKPPLDNVAVFRRCALFLVFICFIPILLILLVTSEVYYRPPPPPPPHNYLTVKQSVTVAASGADTTVGDRLAKRRQYLKQKCHKLGLNVAGNDSLHKPNPWEFLINNQHHLVWCNVFKAASTSWMYNFNILAGYSSNFLMKTKMVPLNLARQRYPRPSLEALRNAFNTSISFLIARHPFERLISAYRDKIQFAKPHTYHRKLGAEIIARYRPIHRNNNVTVTNSPKWPTFVEFVDYLLDCVKKGQPLDMHWTPITEFCTPCMFDFTIIAHMETLAEDQDHLIHLAGIKHLVRPQWRNAGAPKTQQIIEYYSQLPKSKIFQLYHVYRYDFELFNYTIWPYLEAGQQDADPADLLAAITLRDFPRNANLPQVY